MEICFRCEFCGSNDFQDYFDDTKESRVKQVPKNQESKSFKNQVSKNQDSRIIKIKIQDSIKISTKKVFQNIE